jgi:thioredoxin 1
VQAWDRDPEKPGKVLFADRCFVMSKPVLFDFFATWCGPCRMQTPIIEELAKKMGDAVEIRKVDVDQHMDLAEKYGIRVVPTLIIEKDGKVVQSLEGVTDAVTLEKMLRAVV